MAWRPLTEVSDLLIRDGIRGRREILIQNVTTDEVRCYSTPVTEHRVKKHRKTFTPMFDHILNLSRRNSHFLSDCSVFVTIFFFAMFCTLETINALLL